MDRIRGTLAVLALIVLGSLAGCGGSVDYAGEHVKDPSAFLASVENQWHSDLADSRVTRHKDARCYFSVPQDSDNLDTLVYCGPVRHFVDSAGTASNTSTDDGTAAANVEADAGDGIWDTYGFRAVRLDDGYQLSVPKPRAFGVDLSGGLRLLRPDGHKPPDDGVKLAAPPPPPVAKSYLATLDDVAVTNARKPADDRIVTPTITVRVDKIGTASRVVTDDGTKGPAKGERFVVAILSFTPGPDADTYADSWSDSDLVDADVSFALQSGTERRPIKDEPTGDVGWGDKAPQTLVASVPLKSDPRLVVMAAGKEQTLSLTTGKRTAAGLDAYYRRTSKVGVSRQYSAPKFTKGDFELSYSMVFSEAQLTPFDPQRGWAPDGKAWLRLATEQPTIDWTYLDYSLLVDRTRTAVVTDDRGTTAHDLTTSETWDSSADDEITPTFEVDARATKFHVTYAPTFTFAADDSFYSPGRGAGHLRPLAFDVDFGS